MKDFLVLSIFLLFFPFVLKGEKAAVVEFVERTPIGIENSGKVTAELLIDNLQKLGKYQLIERVLLFKLLEEQAIGMTGVISTEEAVKVGKIYGIDYVITGSVMKLGRIITITARVIDAKTGSIIKTGEAKIDNIEKLPQAAELLAYRLSGYTEKEYRSIKESERKTQKRGGVGILGGYSFGEGGTSRAFPGIILLYYTSKFSFDFGGGLPTDPTGELTYAVGGVGFNLNPTFSLGIYGGLGWAPVDVGGNANFQSVLLGIGYRPTYKLRMRIAIGPLLNGTADVNGTILNMAPFSNINADIWITYLFSENLGFIGKISGLGGPTEDYMDDKAWSQIFSFGAGLVLYPSFLR